MVYNVMNTKRWVALVLVICLVFISIGFRFAMNVASGFFDEFMEAFDTSNFEEHIISEGNMNKRIAVLNLEGIIQNSESMWGAGYDHQLFLKMIEHAAEDPTVKGVVLRVDSPGGAVVETAQIHESLVNLQEEYDTPFYVSMGNTAASGGYYVAAPSEKIFAEAATLTGSIGVIMESINYAELAENYGVRFNTIKSGKHKDILSPSREMTKEEEEILQSMVDEMYDDFVQVIVEGRQMDESKVRELADGRVYTGKQAKENNLVDEVGSLKDTIGAMKDDYNLSNAQVIQYGTLFDSKLSVFGVNIQNLFKEKQTEIDKVLSLLNESDKPRAMYIY